MIDFAGWSQLLTLLGQLPSLSSQVISHGTRITNLEAEMTTAQNVDAELQAIIASWSTDITTVTTKITDLQNAITTGNTDAVNAAMATLAPDVARLQELSTQMDSLAAPTPSTTPPTTPTATTAASTAPSTADSSATAPPAATDATPPADTTAAPPSGA